MKRMNFTFVIITICLTFVANSCIQSIRNRDSDVNAWLGKTISFPRELKQLKDTMFYSLDIFEKENNNKNMIVSIVDASCLKCIFRQINITDSLFSIKFVNDTNNVMVFVINVQSLDSLSFKANLLRETRTEGVILWDNNFNFERENDLFTRDLNQRTFMMNPNNKIVQVGNSLLYPKKRKNRK